MNSKEKTLKRLEHQGRINAEEMQKYGRISLISKLETEYLKEVLKDLDELEELKKIMGTPIQDIMKRLKILEILKKKNVYMFRINNCINAEEYNEWVGINVDDELTEDEFNLIKGVVR